MIKQRLKIMVCPLDWGLGHATRCIPLVRELISLNVQVIIAGEGAAVDLLKQEFPGLTYLNLQGYRIKFSTTLPLGIKLLTSFPRLFKRMMVEHSQLDKLVKEHGIDAVISDNRYGLWSKSAYSVFITHQPNIIPPSPLGLTASIIRKATRYLMGKYNECWIPDFQEEVNLSGKLSHGHPLPLNTRFIGLLSRFDRPCAVVDKEYDLVAIISGPEPSRSELEDLLVEQLSSFHLKSILLRGITGTVTPERKVNNLTIVDHLSADKLCSILKTMPVVICRAGYSTLMDISLIGNKIICIPTPGQTEQEYLAREGAQHNKIVHANQRGFSIAESWPKVLVTEGFKLDGNPLMYKKALEDLVTRLNNL